ncbi:MAG: NUDIX domain-containing protein [Candidatus Bathyarchaeia archaeon]|jgi:8-oxo-dGTP diphosphatase
MSIKPWGLSAYILISNHAGNCLLLKRSEKSKYSPGRWEPPGGKVNANEGLDTALLREVLEETSLRISIQHVVGASESQLPKINAVHLIFVGRVESGEVSLSDEHDDYIWANPSDFSSMELVEWFKSFAENYFKKGEPTKHDAQ